MSNIHRAIPAPYLVEKYADPGSFVLAALECQVCNVFVIVQVFIRLSGAPVSGSYTF